VTAAARSVAMTGRVEAGARPVGVLVVDDSVVFRTTMTRAVKACRDLCLLGEAGGGEAALEAIAALDPDVVIIDLQMPDLDALGVLDRLRAEERRRACRVLVISAVLDDVREAELLAAGADACLSKALSRAEICDVALRLTQ
jgi:CheY-like chemotaxis protein